MRVVLGVCLCGAAAFLGYYFWLRAPVVFDPSAVELAGVDPAVQHAIRKATEQVRKSPHSADDWGTLGMIFYNHIFADQALACFAQAERLDADDLRWPYFQGLIVMSYDPRGALPKFVRAAQLSEERSDRPRLRLAELYLQLGQFDDARTTLETLVVRRDMQPRVALGLARIHFQPGEWELCLDFLKPALAHPWTRKSALQLAAEIHQRQGDAQAARRDLAQALSLSDEPEWPDEILEEAAKHGVGEAVRIQRANKLIDQQRLAEAAEQLQGIVRDYPDSAKGWLLLGFAQMNLRQLPQAEASLQTALKSSPQSAPAMLNLGILKMLQKDHRAAADWFRKAIDQKPDALPAHLKLGMCLREVDDRKGAMAAFRDALRCQPLSADAHSHLGALLVQGDQPEAALTHLQQAIELYPNDTAARKLLEDLRKRAAEKN